MLLKDINGSPEEQFSKLNKLINSRFGFSVATNVTEAQVTQSLAVIEEQLSKLRTSTTLSESADLSKYILMKDALILLKEFAIPVAAPVEQNPYRSVVTWLTNMVCDCVCIGDDFEDAIKSAMREYRSSQWRFSDDRVESEVRNQCRRHLVAKFGNDVTIVAPPMVESVSVVLSGDDVTKLVGWLSNSEEIDANTYGKMQDYYQTSCEVPSSNSTDFYANKVFTDFYMPSVNTPKLQTARMTEMKENAVKKLRRLLETEVAEAEIIATARSFAGEVQEMIEKLSRLQNEDLPPLTDSMKEEYGIAVANDFHSKSQLALQGALEALYAAKDEIDNSVISLATGEVVTDMDADLSMDPEFTADPNLAGMGDELGDLAGIEDEFGGADVSAGVDDDPLGRVKRESLINMKAKLTEMQTKLTALKALQAKQGK